MKREIVSATVTVNKVGNSRDYINLPIIRDGKVLGVVTECANDGDYYTLTFSLWQDIGLEMIERKPSAIVFG